MILIVIGSSILAIFVEYPLLEIRKILFENVTRKKELPEACMNTKAQSFSEKETNSDKIDVIKSYVIDKND